ncbi:MAG TPA: hypothetical protein EYO59_02825 [Chromatiaceae bacterium]|jgi:uncharacterized membrane protein YciS (DUF1049 family)|nr:hypothetical protein [Chromatiaceae bacterium]HIB83552.1 hypothetical protein [Chromatiaceae bacterium]
MHATYKAILFTLGFVLGYTVTNGSFAEVELDLANDKHSAVSAPTTVAFCYMRNECVAREQIG